MNNELPELPKPAGSLNWTPTAEAALMPGYTAEQMQAYARAAVEQAKPSTEKYTYGHCENHKQVGGCPSHNLHCGYPECDRRPLAAMKESKP